VSGIQPSHFTTSCGSTIDVTACGSVLDISSRANPGTALANIVRAFDIAASPEAGFASGDDPQLLWMAPRRWWLIRDSGNSPVTSVSGIAVTEIGDAVMRLEIRGDTARDWLSKFCPVDLRVKSFAKDRVAWTSFCESRVLLHCKSGSAFDTYVDRSICQHIVDVCSENFRKGNT
jgi:heterotetrameric sarcosine oxidase gamma subunit